MGSIILHRQLLTFTLSLLALHPFTSPSLCCQAALAPVADARRQGYSQLIRDIRAHPISTEKIPPVITDPLVYIQSSGPDRDNSVIMVMLQVMPVDILQVDPTQQVLEMTSYISLGWKDSGLAWNESEYGGVPMVELSAEELWTPTLTMINGVEDNTIYNSNKAIISLYSTGFMLLSFSINFKTSCKLDIHYFPFDEQMCDIIITPASQTRVHLNNEYQEANKLLEKFSTSGEWALTDLNLDYVDGTTDLNLNYVDGTTTDLYVNATKVVVKLKRNTAFYLVSIVGPMGLFTAINCLVFLIPPDSGEKISFLISIFLSNTVFSSFINGVMPRSLERKIPLMMVYLLFMWFWSLAILLATILVLHKFHIEQNSQANQDNRINNAGPNRHQQKSASSERSWHRCLHPCLKYILTQSKNRVSIRSQAEHNSGQDDQDLPVIPVKENQTAQSQEPEDCHADSANSWAVKAKTLDKMFFCLSVAIVLMVDTAFLIVFDRNSA